MRTRSIPLNLGATDIYAYLLSEAHYPLDRGISFVTFNFLALHNSNDLYWVFKEAIMTTTQLDVDIESYTEYTIGMIVFLTRLGGRVFLVGFRGLALDDVFTVVAAVRLTPQ